MKTIRLRRDGYGVRSSVSDFTLSVYELRSGTIVAKRFLLIGNEGVEDPCSRVAYNSYWDGSRQGSCKRRN